MALHQELGRARVSARIIELNGRIRDGLAKTPGVTLHTPRDPALAAGINCFEVAGKTPQEVVQRLAQQHIRATTSPYKVTYARLAAGIMNTPEEVEMALRAVREVSAA